MRSMNLKLYLILLAAMVFAGIRANAQTHHAFVQQENVQVSGITADSMLYTLTTSQKHTTRVYYDGLGRPIQSVAVGASPLQNDIIQPAAYDHLGRQTVSYLPYAGQVSDTMGSYRSNAISSAQPVFYNQTSQYLIPTDTAAHVNQVIESSPLQRLLNAGDVGKGYQPGDGGTQHYKTISYRPNSNALDGNIYMTGIAGTFTAGTYYADSKLWVTDAKNEDGAEALTFTDLAGRTVLIRRKTGQSEANFDTYYVYNAAGMIKYIVPPKAVHLIINGATFSSTAVTNLIYNYTYNNLGQLVSKTVPGSGITSIVYDPLNRPVLVRDTNLYASHKWHYIKYDAKNRPVETGIYTDATNTTRVAMQSYVSGLSSGYNSLWYESRSTSSTYFYYTNNIFPSTNITALSYSYYDNYDWNNNGGADYHFTAPVFPTNNPEGGVITAPSQATDSLKGVPTMTLTSTIGPGISGTDWLMKVIFYDHYGRAVQVQSSNQLKYGTVGTVTDTTTMAPDFAGKVVAAKTVVESGTSTFTKVYTFYNYDPSGRVIDVDQQYNSQANKHIAHYTYNELGQSIKKNLGYTGSAWLQNVDFRYNIRGQLTSINNSKLSNDGGVTNSDTNDLFGMQVMYDNPDANISGATPSYSGRISAVKWMTVNGTVGTQTNERSYAYSYDKLERYTGSVYAERTAASTSAFNVNTHGFDENNITYDENGNILSLKRNSSSINAGSYTTVDRLGYTYDSNKPNQLDAVTDTAANALGFYYKSGNTGSYGYDTEGNLLSDPYKGLSTKYNNLLNKTDSITVTGTGMLTYTYDAGGNLLRKNTYNSSGTLTGSLDYIGGFVYSSGTISYFSMPEGRVLNTGSTLTPEYVITDQQGNARFSFQDNGSGALRIEQENSYYATGEGLANSPVATPTLPNPNLYNGGNEWQNEFGNLPDYHATFYRNYDPEIGRFTGVDPKAESADYMTSYQYAGDDPVNMNDPMGDLLRAPVYTQSGNQTITSLNNPVLDQLEGGMSDFLGSVDGGGGGTDSPVDGGDYSAYWDKLAADNGLSINKGPSAYSLDMNGHVSYVGDISGTQDMVFADTGNVMYLDNSTTKVELNMAATYINNNGQTVSEAYMDFKITGDKEANSLFEFLINNTKVEWSHLEYGQNKNVVSTSFKSGAEIGGVYLATRLLFLDHILIRELDHNHPYGPNSSNEYGPSGCFVDDKVPQMRGDMGMAYQLTNLNNRFFPCNTIIFNIYDQTTNTIIRYDSQNTGISTSPMNH